MTRKIDNKGVTLLELIIAVAIMAVLIGIVSPMMFKYVERAKQVKVEKEASEFVRAAQVAYIDVCSSGNEPLKDSVKNKPAKNSAYYKEGVTYGNLTNWTVHNGVVAGASNGPFADAFFNILGISYGKNWKSGSSQVPISTSQPKLNPAGSMTNECIFQIFYTSDGDIVVEYSRSGYFVRMENSIMVESVKIKNKSQKYFTSWQ